MVEEAEKYRGEDIKEGENLKEAEASQLLSNPTGKISIIYSYSFFTCQSIAYLTPYHSLY